MLRDDHVRDGELVPLQTAGQNAASFDVAIRVGLRQFEETTHEHRRNHHFAHTLTQELEGRKRDDG